MKADTKKKLEAAGWTVGTVSDFLGLSKEEVEFVETKLALAQRLRKRRIDRGITQNQLARAMQSSQSRIAKMEASDPSVSLDLIVRALFFTGATRRDLASTIYHPRVARPAAVQSAAARRRTAG